MTPLGYNDLFIRSLSHTELAVTALAAGFWLMLRGSWWSTALVLGAAFNLNAFVAFWGGVIAAVAFASSHRGEPMLLMLRRLAGFGLLAAIAALPTALWILRA